MGNTSNLILDPDLDSYYLMDAILLKLPRGQDLLAQARLLGKKSIVRARRPRWRKGRNSSAWPACCAPIGRIPKKGLDVAFRNNPAANLKASLEPPLRDHLATTDALLHAIDGDVVKARTTTISRTPMTGSSSKAWRQTLTSGTDQPYRSGRPVAGPYRRVCPERNTSWRVLRGDAAVGRLSLCWPFISAS